MVCLCVCIHVHVHVLEFHVRLTVVSCIMVTADISCPTDAMGRHDRDDTGRDAPKKRSL